MSFLSALIRNNNLFDNLTQGGYDSNSVCGSEQKCYDVKGCISRACSPYQGSYGGAYYSGCVQACNQDPSIADAEEFLCANPRVAYDTYGVLCQGYDPDNPPGTINILGTPVSFVQIAIVIVLAIVIYIIYKRF